MNNEIIENLGLELLSPIIYDTDKGKWKEMLFKTNKPISDKDLLELTGINEIYLTYNSSRVMITINEVSIVSDSSIKVVPKYCKTL